MFTTSPSDSRALCKALVHDPSESSALERVDNSTREIIANVFPAPTRGQVFFARFLERAGRERSILPDESEESVYICTKSIATLGKELDLSNDTTQKYVVLYMALGLLAKRKVMGQLAFVMHIGIYQPPETIAANLDFLIQKATSRPKLRTMAIEVKARCQIYGLIQQDLVGSLEQLQLLLHIDKGISRRMLEQRLAQAQYLTSKVFKTVLTSHLSAESTLGDGPRRRKEHILPQNLPKDGDVGGNTSPQENQDSAQWLPVGGQGKESCSQNLPRKDSWGDSVQGQRDEESPQRGIPGRFSEEGISSRLLEKAGRVDSVQDEREGKSTQHDTARRLEEKYAYTRLPETANQRDSPQHQRQRESPENGELGRSSQPGASSRLPKSTGQGDSSQGDQRTSLTESPQSGQASRREDDHLRSKLPILLHQGDSGRALRNVDVEHIYNFMVTFTLREPQRVAEFLAEQLEGDRRVYPKYQKLFYVQDGQVRDPHVLAAAFICTMVRLHRDQWNISKRPGGFFTKRCREYDAGVPKEVEGWLTSYGQLSPAALLEALTKQGRAGHAPVPEAVVQPSYQKPAPRPLPPLALSPQLRVEPAQMVMSRDEAQALVQAILHDHRTQLFRAQRLRIGKQIPRYAVLVDASVPGGPPRQTVVYSCAEWQARLEAMRTWRDLIYPSPCSPPYADTGRSPQGKETNR